MAAEPERWLCLDGTADEEAVFESLWSALGERGFVVGAAR
jgi:hypothetical protein